ncbi:MAG TPA: hypothetical protein VEK13_00225 [Thermoplasmata archaeon]|nr:hypothetical protein [Thermoplasmata archaeon]
MTGRRTILPLGRNGSGRVVGPVLDPVQGRHVAVLGETGMGKSSLLVAVARRVSQDHGLVVLDPLGTTSAAIEQELCPDARRRLLWIAPLDGPPRFNALEGIAQEGPRDLVRSERRLNDLVHSLRRVRSGRYADSAYWGPRIEEMVTRALQAAAEWPQGTLVEAHTLLATGGRLHQEIPPGAQGPVRELAQRIRERPDDAEGARRLLHEIVRSPVLEHMLCAPVPDLSSSELVRPGRVVLVSGDAAHVGESTARYLLSVFLAIIWSELLSRPSRTKTFLLLDEAQWFAHESLAEILRLGRFANVHTILATQAVASLPSPVAEAVWTNVADLVAFRGSPEEARELAHLAHGISTEAVLSLPRGHAVVLLGKGEAVHWLRTLRLPERSSANSARTRQATSDDDSGLGANATSSPASKSAYVIGGRESSPVRVQRAGTPDGPESVREGGDPAQATAEQVIAYLRSLAESSPPGTPIRVTLEDLRKHLDPDGLAVRRAGARLSASGAILRTERTPTGTVWTLSPDRFPPAAVPGNEERTLGDTPPSHPS